MNLTLLVEGTPRIESFYKLNLSTWLGLDTTSTNKLDDALTLIETGPKPKLIIVRAVMGKAEVAKSLINWLALKQMPIPVIVIGPGAEVPGSFAHVPNSLQIKILIQNAAKALNITAQDMSNKVVPDFFPIPIAYFRELKRPVSNVYLHKDKKFEVILPRLQEIDQKTINQYLDENIDFLYVDKMDRLEFVNNITSELMAHLKSEELSKDEQISASDKSIELLSKKLAHIGVTAETIELANKTMANIRKNVKSHPKLSQLMDRLLQNKTSYLFKHTQILTYVSLHIIQNIDWGTPEQEEKIAFISFFHDIVLESDLQAQIKSTLELKRAKFSEQERLLVERHAQLAAEYVTKFPHAPMGSDQIIRQHHGTMNGVGFSEHYGNNVSPVSVVFIVAEEFTRIIMKNESGPFDKADMLRELKEEFPTSRFQKVLEKLQTLMI
jgi:HD-GYP domain-containing protein (c-di-GMP phosphodiesterase class II)